MTRKRTSKLFRWRQRPAEALDNLSDLGAKAEDQLERNLMRRFGRLMFVKRFVGAWLSLVLALVGLVVVQTRALGSYYQTMQPVPGGIYNEGIVGAYTNANPLYAVGQVNDAVSKLLFASLFTYGEHNKLVGDLAESYTVDPAGTTYAVRLRPNLHWQDGQPLTADDVVFTYHSIQNPDVESPLNVSWQNVTVSANGDRYVIFKLPNPLSSFPYSLMNGIIPQHLLATVKPANFRSMAFNTTKPLGAGPFRLQTIEVQGNSPSTRQEEVQLVPFDGYHNGKPKLSSLVIHAYPDQTSMVNDFSKHLLTSMVGLQQVPDKLVGDATAQATFMPLTAANMVFFKTSESSAPPLADAAVRQALVTAIDVDKVTKDLPPPVLPVREPLLQSAPGYDPALVQLHGTTQEAAAMLDKAGWLPDKSGIRHKGNQPLLFKLYTLNSPENAIVTHELQRQWRQVGAMVQVFNQADVDLRSTVASHAYDALLYGISLGVDPDEYVYWHSSQSDVRSASRLNLSEYHSAAADSALEDGRTRQDPTLRAIKYRPFLQAWQQDAPALGLYQPRFLYIIRGQVNGLTDRALTTDTDRFNNVQDWTIRKVMK